MKLPTPFYRWLPPQHGKRGRWLYFESSHGCYLQGDPPTSVEARLVAAMLLHPGGNFYDLSAHMVRVYDLYDWESQDHYYNV